MSRARSHEIFTKAKTLIPGGVNSPARAFGGVGGEPIVMRRVTARICGMSTAIVTSTTSAPGSAHSGTPASGGRRGDSEGPRIGNEFRGADRIGIGTGRVGDRRGPVDRKGADGEFRNRGLDERLARRAGLHRPRQDHQIRRVLPRACRRPVGEGWQCGDDVGSPQQPRRTSGLHGRHDCPRIQRPPVGCGDICPSWHELAAVVLEPVVGNMGLVLPEPGFLEGLRELCTRHGVLLVFDEVMTGFRVAFGGVQERTGVRPDMTILGKIIGGGMPVGAYGGRADVMDMVSPVGPCTRRGPCPGIPWRWPRALRLSKP